MTLSLWLPRLRHLALGSQVPKQILRFPRRCFFTCIMRRINSPQFKHATQEFRPNCHVTSRENVLLCLSTFRPACQRGSNCSCPCPLSSQYLFSCLIYFIFFFVFFFFLFFFWATSAAYWTFQARGPVRAVAASLCHSHSMPDLSCVCNLHHSSQ